MVEKKTCLITVGTTRFDGLMQILNSRKIAQKFCTFLKNNNFGNLIVQRGNGTVVPLKLKEFSDGIDVTILAFSNELRQIIEMSDLIISHGGAGTIFEVLAMKKDLFVVVNENLMENHQMEIIEKMADFGHLFYSRLKDFAEKITAVDFSALKKYETVRENCIAKDIDRFYNNL
ncbi:hypothetical protein MHBO_002969 [Bonamia ostreae]|uniref:Glycosyl transferase family 28 C-terminal domain-containing protein n=1 Tax=Bonamia ostreae TaxID=126728 RepID=A0ABV2AP43_9EUKA